jgi:hypothetical protein
MHIQQAIFTSARTDRGDGYQLVASSPGFTDEDAQDLQIRGPSHDSMADARPGSQSVNFHRLPSGAFAVSRTVLAGAEYSERGALRVYTQFLAVPADLFDRFSNNPFAVLRAVMAQGAIDVINQPPRSLPAIRLVGRASAFDEDLVRRVAERPEGSWLGTLVDHATRGRAMAVLFDGDREALMEALLLCCPPELRRTQTFSTCLRPSARRPVRILVIPCEAEDRRKLRRADLTVADLSVADAPPAPNAGWGAVVQRAALTGDWLPVSDEVARVNQGANVLDLTCRATEILGSASPPSIPRPASSASMERPAAEFPVDPLRDTELIPDSLRATLPLPTAPQWSPVRFRTGTGAVCLESDQDPSVLFGAKVPRAARLLQRADDAIFDALAGRAGALCDFQTVWPKVHAQLSGALGEALREQYLRHALAVWRHFEDGDQLRDANRAIAALEVVSTVLGERD